ncbi:uncharacterized protein LOC110985430 [Acanthaster planci]|uniref:Uncharacterized protein LOC110985430 n=1 Tax=Acanthaster planci TaxID=133434 RepID=A0A8B7Z8Y9_ACAPL|nr:uncharacterized protein LOC110985430 [Acanthaster planci]
MAADHKPDATGHELDVQTISAVREFPCLYDPSSKDYRDNRSVIEAWTKIAEICGANDWTECKERWRKLRDAYVKVKKKTSIRKPGTYKTPWVHYDSMSFLANYIKHRNVTKRPLDTDEDVDGMSAEETLEAMVANPPKGKRGRKIDPMVTIVETIGQASNTKMAADASMDDEDGLFGRMVAATLRRFPPRAKARCKFRIQEIIFQQENENLGSSP